MNTSQQNAPRTQSRIGAPSALERVRQAAKWDRGAKFTALFHYLTLDRLRDAFRALQRTAAPGVDGVTWAQYADGLEEQLRDLHARLHRGAYRAQPSRRVFIPKADGRSRPLGIASLEDKIVQRAVVEILNAIYETDFVGFTYGVRPGRSPHDALDALAAGLAWKKVNWVLDADIRGFFDASRLADAAIEHPQAGWAARPPSARQRSPEVQPQRRNRIADVPFRPHGGTALDRSLRAPVLRSHTSANTRAVSGFGAIHAARYASNREAQVA